MFSHILIRKTDGTILESKGAAAAERLAAAMGEGLERETFELRPPDHEAK